MATAAKQARTPRQRDDAGTGGVPREFLIFESNGGDYRWEIVAEGGVMLAQSGSFVSFADAEQAAIRVRDGAAATRVGPGSAGDRAPVRGRKAVAAGLSER